MSDDRIIDIGGYLGGSSPEPGRAFALWGGEGDRSRLALPIWRAIYLLSGDRGGIVWEPSVHASDLCTFFVLDLAEEPARTSFPPALFQGLEKERAPVVSALREGGRGVFLGEAEGKRWYVAIDGGEPDRRLKDRVREELLFLAGECAGLLFFRELAREAR